MLWLSKINLTHNVLASSLGQMSVKGQEVRNEWSCWIGFSQRRQVPQEKPFHRASFVGSRLRSAALSTSLLFGGRMLEGIHNLCTYTRVTESHYLVENGAQRVSPNWEKTVAGEVCPFSRLLLSFYVLRHLIMQPWLIYNFLCRPSWPHTHKDLSCTIIPRCVLIFLFDCLIYFGYCLQ